MASVRGKKPPSFLWDVPVLVSEALSIINNCQPHMQQKPNTKLRDLLKNKKAKTRKLSELSKTEQKRLAKLNSMLDEFRCGENVTQNSSQLKTGHLLASFECLQEHLYKKVVS